MAQARGFDEAEGVSFKVSNDHPDLRVMTDAELRARPNGSA